MLLRLIHDRCVINRAELKSRLKSILKAAITIGSIIYKLTQDNFKMINDNYGHIAGDMVLTSIMAEGNENNYATG